MYYRQCLASASQADIRAYDEQLARDGIAGRYTHRMDGDTQWRYDDWLAEQCGPDTPLLPPWRQHMYEITGDASPWLSCHVMLMSWMCGSLLHDVHASVALYADHALSVPTAQARTRGGSLSSTATCGRTMRWSGRLRRMRSA